MSFVKILPSNLSGNIKTPPSKSLCHRAIIAAGLSDGVSKIKNVMMSKDIEATCSAMKSLGIEIEIKDHEVTVTGTGKLSVINDEINCIESGSTLRFLIPIALVSGDKVTFDGMGRLKERPLKPYYEIFKKQNISFSSENGLPLTLDGRLKPDIFNIQGDISSQFITGLLFALPLLNGDSEINVTTELQSKGYVDMTLDVLKKYSVDVVNSGYNEFIIKGNQKYVPSDYSVEGDFSQAAFWLVAGILGANGSDGITCTDLNENSLQRDKVIVDIIKKMGGNIIIGNNSVKSLPSWTNGIDIDVSECPDIVPVLAVLGALSHGTTRILNAGRLRLKESDRLKAISTELNKIGAHATEKKDSLIIEGIPHLTGGEVKSWNDHRIAMALSVASIRCTQPVTIDESSCVEKSYPDFFEDFIALGGKCL